VKAPCLLLRRLLQTYFKSKNENAICPGRIKVQKLTYQYAFWQAAVEEMLRDSTVFLMGEDIDNNKALVEAVGKERVRGCPISESAFTGASVGAAAGGLRPIVWLMFGSFMYVAMDQLVNQAAKLRYMSGGQFNLPIVYWVPMGSGFAGAAQHSDHPTSLFINSPGFKVVLPSDVYDAIGLFRSAVRDDNPVIIFEQQELSDLSGEIPEDEYTIPIGKGDIKRTGTDVTVVAAGAMVPQALSASEKLQKEGISLEIIDPRTLVPMDKEIILDSVKRTGKLVVFEDAPLPCSFASEVAATVAQDGFDLLKAPIFRVTREHIPIPFSPPLENQIIANEGKLITAIRKLLKI
jgi:pyruvate dehydrogenase E1 component beta subunit